LGSGISGSGPSIFALSRGTQTAKKVGEAMVEVYNQLNLENQLYLSKINTEGIKVLSQS
jgi:homoserine kinase